VSGDASVSVGLGDVSVDLQVSVQPSSEVDATLTFRGVSVSFTFAGDGSVSGVRLPDGPAPEIRT
jgi:hypothetical protein